jgi:hypothetical protein
VFFEKWELIIIHSLDTFQGSMIQDRSLMEWYFLSSVKWLPNFRSVFILGVDESYCISFSYTEEGVSKFVENFGTIYQSIWCHLKPQPRRSGQCEICVCVCVNCDIWPLESWRLSKLYTRYKFVPHRQHCPLQIPSTYRCLGKLYLFVARMIGKTFIQGEAKCRFP